MIRQFELVETVRAYDKNIDEALLNRAYVFAMKAHGTQTRASGDPYFSHPLEVAGILTDMKLDCNTIATALLHDVVEDTVATIPEIEELFGPKVAELVDGVTKLSKIEMQTESLRQAENFRKFLLAMSNDIRVLLVKLADRLHNMRTLFYIKKPEKRRRIALETIEIYSPLAERIGMHAMKDELEHLAFQHLDAEAMESINARLHYLIEESPDLETDMVGALAKLMDEHGIKANISGRIKRPYSIWRKMERQNISFEQLSDVMAFRVKVEDVETCYRALGVVHQRYPMVPGRFKDYISTPKRNFYRSIHTTVMGPQNHRLEVQIRTHKMHEQAEYGVAAHWQYKQQNADNVEGSQYRWVRELLEILEHTNDPEEFLEHTKLEMFQDKVFCFTPKGELISLPRGSSTVDFAYAVHTEVGDHCVGAKVNGRMVPLRHQIENGDQVQILTSKGQSPSPRWESFVATGKARAAIRRHVKAKERSEYGHLGKTLIEKACRRNGLDFSSQVIVQAAKVLNLDDADMLYALVGQGTLQEEEILRAAFPGFKEDARAEGLPTVHHDWEAVDDGAIPISGMAKEGAVHFADCCHPVRGDRIVGIRVPGKGAEIHTIDCGVLKDYDDRPDLWIDLRWEEDDSDNAFYAGRLRLEVINERGALAAIAATVSKSGGNISNLVIPERDPEFYIMVVDVEVRDVKHLNDISRALRVSRVISRVDRVSG
ncbi:RelA/SpoT family protein [Kordiimonas aestuarii]|uniref:RelA/SpoT family protein n=1 Tax=Kordiimonas aestuarii TaxID=1005925 RepID=UPI0021D32A8E|nr:bifunctional (p)ppGpp synthetase/guanosine-3',5'-bis(diphosphate) 3'-pyrophosphohydrolase [Kordiimonas aestuarii]